MNYIAKAIGILLMLAVFAYPIWGAYKDGVLKAVLKGALTGLTMAAVLLLGMYLALHGWPTK